MAAQTKIKYRNSATLTLTINNLAGLGKTFADITDVIFMFKESHDQPDASAPFSKTLGSGVTLDSGNEKVVVAIDVVDFGVGKIISDSTYLIAIGIEFNTSGEYLEDSDDAMKRNIYIIKDKVDL